MKTETQVHWSGPNGCYEGCPSCAEERSARTSRHAPGPWVLQTLSTEHNGYDDWPTFCVRSGEGNHCLAVVGDVDRATAGRNEANARLMVAAPDLLAALKATLVCMEESHADEIESHHYGDGPSCSYCRMMDGARAAIAKATGGVQ